jgi:hypothetical protein
MAGKHYRIITAGQSWDNAAGYCMSQGGYLVTYYTRQEQIDVEVRPQRPVQLCPPAGRAGPGLRHTLSRRGTAEQLPPLTRRATSGRRAA